ILTTKESITTQGLENSAAKVVEPGTVVVATRMGLGKVSIAKIRVAINQDLKGLVLYSGILEKYLTLYLKSYASEIERLGSGVTVKGIRLDELKSLLIPIPYPENQIRSLDIQGRIVARIETLLAEVQESRRLIYKTRKDTEQLLSVALNEVFLNLESLLEIVSFSEVATAFNGRASGEGNSNIRVFKTKHVYPHYLRLTNPSYTKAEQVKKIPKDRYIQPDDVLMANIAEGTLGRVSYVQECEEFWTVDTQIMILRSRNQKKLLGKWLYYYLWSEQGQRQILSRRTGIAFADKRGQTHIYPKNVANIPVPLPPLNQQRQAVAYLEHIQHEADEILKLLEQDAKLLDMLEKSILERAFRGKL
ncbi:MAG: restriction endonuclease subunit S, partial [Scytonema sp. PMC 1069.18]|nr:restriction endonuclease subunit S [Scytonema sp. PMC 1069.18]